MPDNPTKPFRVGLVVGKFSPLHRGHELNIARAFELCREVILISYSNPELPGCEAEKREQWLAALFPRARTLVVTGQRLLEWFPHSHPAVTVPHNDAADTIHRQFTARLCRELLGLNVDAVFTSEDYGDGFAAALTAYIRQHDPSAAAVQHVQVDRDRTLCPISGTRIRADVHAHRQWLSPIVYASFVRRICLLGGEASGKSTLTQALARQFDTRHVPEYGRELWEAKNGALTFEDMLRIAERQIVAEDRAVLQARRFVFCDTSPLTTLFYSRHVFQCADPALEKLAARPYDLVVLCAPDFAFVQDGTRQPGSFRDRQHAWYLSELARRNVPFLLATGGLENRMAQVAARL